MSDSLERLKDQVREWLRTESAYDAAIPSVKRRDVAKALDRVRLVYSEEFGEDG